jgi:hypothetical protein
MTLPPSTEHWQRPSRAFDFPSNIDICDPAFKHSSLHVTVAHLNLIARSSFHQVPTDLSPPIHAPIADHMYTMRDHASWFFLDRALVAFEMFEEKGNGLKDIRVVFPGRREGVLWSIWWWANGGDKARAKMERWREVAKGRQGRRLAVRMRI